MAHPGGIDVVYDTIGTAGTSEIGVRLLRQRGTLVKSGVNAPKRWSGRRSTSRRSPGSARTRSGSRPWTVRTNTQSPITSRWPQNRRVDLEGMLTHTFTLENWREAFTALATQDDSGAIKVAFDFRDLGS